HGELLVAAHEVLVVVADQPARQQVRLDQHLEAVADAEYGHPGCRGNLHLGHDRRQSRDSTRAQVVAVAEPAGQHQSVHAFEVVRAMPERHRLGTGDAHGTLRVAVVQRAREGDDPDAGGHWVTPATSTPTTSSMTALESTSSARRRASASTSSVTSPSTVSSKRLPMRTWLKPSTPSRAKAPETAFPCGSRSSALGMTSTTMVGIPEILGDPAVRNRSESAGVVAPKSAVGRSCARADSHPS